MDHVAKCRCPSSSRATWTNGFEKRTYACKKGPNPVSLTINMFLQSMISCGKKSLLATRNAFLAISWPRKEFLAARMYPLQQDTHFFSEEMMCFPEEMNFFSEINKPARRNLILRPETHFFAKETHFVPPQIHSFSKLNDTMLPIYLIITKHIWLAHSIR